MWMPRARSAVRPGTTKFPLRSRAPWWVRTASTAPQGPADASTSAATKNSVRMEADIGTSSRAIDRRFRILRKADWQDCCSVTSARRPRMRSIGCEAEQAGRVLDKNAFPDGLVRRDDGQQIEQISFVRRAPGREGVAVRPIGSPDHPIRRCRDDGLSKGHHIHEGELALRAGLRHRADLIEAAQLHPKAFILE